MFSRAPIGLCPYVMIPRVELGLRKARDQKFAILLASQRKMMKIKHSEVFNPVEFECFSKTNISLVVFYETLKGSYFTI